ncbi:phospholipase A2 [Nonomuraea roseoviolacea]|uniref:Phospholipase n=1 Tax=Nonomuraea roseoviolacea subsp. carminata TaxID=160689 RepID=A0ABT1K8P6_9ACTN|nr:phospholipase A2 [Nonomuraea roseoviolacea]MCP2350378.1 hypothetical protein [Nonomuraea roseoviolacea subsp. carminata]
MKRLGVVTAVMGLTIPLLTAFPAQANASVTETDPPADVQSIGPGQYFSDITTFEITESDVPEGEVGRRHSVAAVDGALAQLKAVPASRTDLAVFGPGWQAEFLGGSTSRKLQVQSGSIVVTELDGGGSTSFALKSSADFPGGGGVRKYEAEDGSKITETSRWDAAAGALRTTISETIPMDPDAVEEGDDGFTNGSGEPVDPADLTQTYTWEKAGTAQDDPWRVTALGSRADGTSSVAYDAQGRVATVTEPAAGEQPQTVLTFQYATTTTATGTATGDYAGRLKQITLAAGSGAPETVASYAYDSGGLLRGMGDPRLDASQRASYAYDGTGRLTTVNSRLHGDWQLTFTGDSAAPAATATSTTRRPDTSSGTPPALSGPAIPDAGATGPPPGDFPGGDVTGPLAYPSYCYAAVHWLWYSRSGCAAWAAHYGWHYPYWKQLPTGYWVVGINYDHCTSSPDRPSRFKFDFRSACDMHDYGYGLIGNTYKGYRYYLDRNRKSDVDNLFYITLRDWTCPAYKGTWFKQKKSTICKRWAWIYRQGVRKGNPKNGANKT